MKTKDVLKLSKDMMVGYKWELFKLDVSFVGWYILGFVTFNISNLVFTTPYINATKVEAYMTLRSLAKTKGIRNANKLSDLTDVITEGIMKGISFGIKLFKK